MSVLEPQVWHRIVPCYDRLLCAVLSHRLSAGTYRGTEFFCIMESCAANGGY